MKLFQSLGRIPKNKLKTHFFANFLRICQALCRRRVSSLIDRYGKILILRSTNISCAVNKQRALAQVSRALIVLTRWEVKYRLQLPTVMCLSVNNSFDEHGLGKAT